MPRIFTADSAAAAFVDVSNALIFDGERIAPRGQMTRELRNVVITLNDPTDCLMLGMGRNMNSRLAVMEALQLIGGFSDPARMAEVAPNTKQFWNGGILLGAYGPRIRPQMSAAVHRLIEDPYTRQAVVTIWDPQYDQQDGVRDIPCTISFNWHIRDGRLHQTTHMRSNDIFWGWTYDAVMFTQLQCSLAHVLNIDVGTYTHVVDSMHVYERDFDAIAAVNIDTREARRLHGLRATSMSGLQQFASQIFYGDMSMRTRGLSSLRESERWMYDVLHS